MTYLAIDTQKNFLVLQKSQKEYQQVICSSKLNNVTESLAMLANKGADMDSNEAQALQYYQEMYDQQNATLETQLKAINAQIEGFQKIVDTNIKTDCKLNISV